MSLETLFRVVEEALTGGSSVKILQQTLSAHQSQFLHCERSAQFFTPRQKHASLLAQLDSAQVRLLGDRIGVNNEAYCQTLLFEATSQALNYG